LRDGGLNYCGIFGVNYSGSQHLIFLTVGDVNIPEQIPKNFRTI
jgi:hypothetical protein